MYNIQKWPVIIEIMLECDKLSWRQFFFVFHKQLKIRRIHLGCLYENTEIKRIRRNEH